MTRALSLLFAALMVGGLVPATAQDPTFTHADSLRGNAAAPERGWWDVTFYDLHVAMQPADSTIRGWNTIVYRVTGKSREMQVDLQVPLRVDSVIQDGRALRFRRDGNAFFIRLASAAEGRDHPGRHRLLPGEASGGGESAVGRRPHLVAQPRRRPPGSASRARGSAPASGGRTRTPRPTSRTASGSRSPFPTRSRRSPTGGCAASSVGPDGTTTYEWFVTTPINNYARIRLRRPLRALQRDFEGENGPLTVKLWPLTAHLEPRAPAVHAGQADAPVLRALVRAVSLVRDGYKLVETPHLGMEHQSAVAYGNGFVERLQGAGSVGHRDGG